MNAQAVPEVPSELELTLQTSVVEARLQLPDGILSSGDALVAQAMAVRVTDAEGFETAAELAKAIKLNKKQRLDWFKPAKDILNSLKDTVLGREKAAVAQHDRALAHLDNQSTAWRTEQIRQENEERRRREEEERKRIAAERKAQAKAALKDGDKKLAKQIQAAPIVVPEVVIPSAVPQATGVRRRVNWKFRVTNAAKVPREWCVPDEKEIGKFVRDNGEQAIGKIPGIEVYSEEHTL